MGGTSDSVQVKISVLFPCKDYLHKFFFGDYLGFSHLFISTSPRVQPAWH
jgi:hypothetical protein